MGLTRRVDLMIGYSDFATRVRSLNDHSKTAVELWAAAAAAVKWKSVQGRPTPVYQAGARFALTDGRAFSEDPSYAAAGVTPLLAVSNVKYAGRERRFKEDWNTEVSVDKMGGKTTIKWSVLPVQGYQTPLGGVAAYMRSYMPMGMHMGEADIKPVLAPIGASNPILASVTKEYGSRNGAGYVRIWYSHPTGQDANFRSTDWDGYGEATSGPAADVALAAGYKGWTDASDTATYAYLERIYHRVPVRNSWVDIDMDGTPPGVNLFPENTTGRALFEVYDPTGRPYAVLRQDGNVAFDSSNAVSTSGGGLDAIVNIQEAGPFLKIVAELGTETKIEGSPAGGAG